jgi:hypothetical protein
MTWKASTGGRSRIDSIRFGLSKPRLILFGSNDSVASRTSTSSFAQSDRSWEEEKALADPYVQVRLNEQEAVLENVEKAIETTKNLVLTRIDDGSKMTFLIAYTQLKNSEAERDHLFGVIGQLEYLRREIEDSDEYFDWKRQCDEILKAEPLKFSVKDDDNLTFDELKEQVGSYCRSPAA